MIIGVAPGILHWLVIDVGSRILHLLVVIIVTWIWTRLTVATGIRHLLIGGLAVDALRIPIPRTVVFQQHNIHLVLARAGSAGGSWFPGAGCLLVLPRQLSLEALTDSIVVPPPVVQTAGFVSAELLFRSALACCFRTGLAAELGTWPIIARCPILAATAAVGIVMGSTRGPLPLRVHA